MHVLQRLDLTVKVVLAIRSTSASTQNTFGKSATTHRPMVMVAKMATMPPLAANDMLGCVCGLCVLEDVWGGGGRERKERKKGEKERMWREAEKRTFGWLDGKMKQRQSRKKKEEKEEGEANGKKLVSCV